MKGRGSRGRGRGAYNNYHRQLKNGVDISDINRYFSLVELSALIVDTRKRILSDPQWKEKAKQCKTGNDNNKSVVMSSATMSESERNSLVAATINGVIKASAQTTQLSLVRLL